jgi:hypothetical protein
MASPKFGRKLKIWQSEYLHYHYLWPHIEWAISKALNETKTHSPFILDVGCGLKPYAHFFNHCRY